MPGWVLVVDDDPATCDAIVVALGFVGLTGRAATNGRVALAMVEDAEPALVLLDLHMPEMGGEAMARTLNATGHHIPIIVVSGNRDAAQVAQAIGAVTCIPKPFALAHLMAAVKQCLAQPA